MEKIIISNREIAETAAPAEQPTRLEPKLPPPVPRWAKVALSPLVLVLPVLCLVTVALRIAMRGLPPRTRYAWLAFLSSLLIVSGIVTSTAAVLVVSLAPRPSKGLWRVRRARLPRLWRRALASEHEIAAVALFTPVGIQEQNPSHALLKQAPPPRPAHASTLAIRAHLRGCVHAILNCHSLRQNFPQNQAQHQSTPFPKQDTAKEKILIIPGTSLSKCANSFLGGHSCL